MRILVLDDDKARLELFQRNLIGHLVTCVETAPEAIQQLTEQVFQVVFLDHDLGGKVFQESGEGTGWEVAKWLSENPTRKPVLTVLHSFNEAGRKNMLALLPEAVEAPGVWLMPIEFKEKTT